MGDREHQKTRDNELEVEQNESAKNPPAGAKLSGAQQASKLERAKQLIEQMGPALAQQGIELSIQVDQTTGDPYVVATYPGGFQRFFDVSTNILGMAVLPGPKEGFASPA